jgi:hypothetical protein
LEKRADRSLLQSPDLKKGVFIIQTKKTQLLMKKNSSESNPPA